MATTQFQLENNVTKTPADIVTNAQGKKFIYTSADQANGTGQDLSTGLRVIVDYTAMAGDNATHLQAIVEAKSLQGTYYPLAYQFEIMKPVLAPQVHQIVLQPDMFWLDAGIGNLMFVGNKSIAVVSNQQGIMPQIWRVRVQLTDLNLAFASVTMNIYGERFNNA